ncbi:hypothetical protein HUT07_18925 [Stenotrophomonas sp. NA06056]|nr:hypothetical protein [Stenotrophomonas sp. NA06056]QKW58574.1 hypothetical protein HUT07_18925 [Stenotrophomonas sp. NA06056]
MLVGHPVGMAQQNPRFPPVRRRAHGRPRPVPFAAPTVDLEVEYQFWQVYDRVVRPLPGGGFRLAWLVLQTVYRARARYPDDTHAVALSRVLFGSNMTAGRAAELEELYALASRRLAAVAVRRLSPGNLQLTRPA